MHTSRPPQVLIVEDEPSIARVFARILKSHGLDPVTAGDGSIALGLLAAQRWDAVVIDVHLPGGVNGLDVLRSASARDASLPGRSVVTSGDLDPETRDSIAALGCFTCLEKPFPAARLVEVVRAVIERDRATDAKGLRHA